METQLVTEQKKKKKLDANKQYLIDIIKASEKYERLLVNSDFLSVLKDLENLVELHNKEIQGFLSAYSMSTSFFKRLRLMEVISQHQLRKEQIETASKYPASIVERVASVREQLEAIKEQEEKENSNG